MFGWGVETAPSHVRNSIRKAKLKTPKLFGSRAAGGVSKVGKSALDLEMFGWSSQNDDERLGSWQTGLTPDPADAANGDFT